MSYRVLTMTGCDISAGAKYFSDVVIVDCLSELADALKQDAFDFVIIPFSAEGLRMGAEAAKATAQAWLCLIPAPSYSLYAGKCFAAGLLAAPEGKLSGVIGPLIAMNARLSRLERERSRLIEKLDNSKYLNRAKLLLMSRLGMSEAQAHRYIEKTAMDTSTGIREVSLNIIRTYEE